MESTAYVDMIILLIILHLVHVTMAHGPSGTTVWIPGIAWLLQTLKY